MSKIVIVLVAIFCSVATAERSCNETALACEHQADVTVTCLQGQVLEVVSAFYGRKAVDTCGHNHNINCAAGNSLEKIKANCQGKNSCDLRANNDVFGDPCPDIGKYIEMKYECVNADRYIPKEAIACEHHTAVTVTCAIDEVIVVTSGFYGRDDYTTCPGNVFTTNCAAGGSLDILRTTCNNKQSCTITADNGIFGDPCPETNKLIKMGYYCVQKAAENIQVQQAFACESGNDVRVTCPAKHVMIVADDADPVCQSNVDTDSSAYLKCKCNNQNSCLLQTSNPFSGESCANTNKFIKLDYYCVPESITLHLASACEHGSPVAVLCEPNQQISVVQAFYGRDDDRVTCPGNIFDTNCAAEGSSDTIKNLCNGNSFCILYASNRIFGDPCEATNKLIKMYYHCI